MELKSFRELLLKKAVDDPTLQTIIDVMKDELIAEKVLESLEKMARPQASMGRSANPAVTTYGGQMKNKDVEMMRDALAHHVSHYKAALKNGQRDIADQHLNKIIPLMHLAGKASAHSNGQLGLDYIPLEPWETNYTTPERRSETGKLKEGTKGLRRRLNSTSRDVNPRSVPDYRYLEMEPHEEHSDTERSPHKGGYPFEEIQLGNPAKIDAKEAYLNIIDPGKQDTYVPHPFDEHPIHNVADVPHGSMGQKDIDDITQKIHDFNSSEHNAKWMQGVKQLHEANPEGFKSRGKVKPGHHYEGINLLSQPHKLLPAHIAAKFNKPQEAAPASAPAEATKPAEPKQAKYDVNALPPHIAAKFRGNK